MFGNGDVTEDADRIWANRIQEKYCATHYADIVLSQSYRRSYRTVAAAIIEAAEELPEEYLFDHLVEFGRAQRSLWKRLNAFRGEQ